MKWSLRSLIRTLGHRCSKLHAWMNSSSMWDALFAPRSAMGGALPLAVA